MNSKMTMMMKMRRTRRKRLSEVSIKLPERPLSNFDFEKFTKKLKIPHFRGVFMRNSFPKKVNKNEFGVINLDDENGPGTHWTAYKKIGKSIEYFDSYGNLKPPIEAIRYFNSNGPCSILYNHDANQFLEMKDYHCGHLCLAFLFNK